MDRPCIVAASTDGTAWLWDLPSGAHARLTGHETFVGAVDSHPDGRYVATRRGDTVRLWTMDGLEPVEVRQSRHGAAIASMDFSPDGDFLITGSQDTTARIWDL